MPLGKCKTDRVLPELGRVCRCVRVRSPRETPIMLDGEMAAKGPELAILPDGGEHLVSAVVACQMRSATFTGLEAATIDLRRPQPARRGRGPGRRRPGR